jgi:hypothetical protein
MTSLEPMVVDLLAHSKEGRIPARIIHERFYCNRRSASCGAFLRRYDTPSHGGHVWLGSSRGLVNPNTLAAYRIVVDGSLKHDCRVHWPS